MKEFYRAIVVPRSSTHILPFHRAGLSRFTKVIDSNPNYDALFSGKIKSNLLELFANNISLDTKIAHAIAYTRDILLNPQAKPVKLILPRNGSAACYGSTKNNLREFEWFERLCENAKLNITSNNIHSYPRTVVAERDEHFIEIAEVLIEDIAWYYKQRSNITPALVQQQSQYTHTFFTYLLSFTAADAIWPGLMVLANDHAPSPVAVSMVMKGANVPRVYLQHAEVTPSFPPLDFEYSVLRNARSLDIYKQIGIIKGKVFIIPREEKSFAADLLQEARGEKTTVVIYPTSRIIPEKLKELIKTLQKNILITKIYIKPHPNSLTPIDADITKKTVVITTEPPSEPHVAIVGNSSVAIEILHTGTPVYQNFSFDPVAKDYYGFVRDGITMMVSTQELLTRFWTPYKLTPKWIEAYSQLNPAANPDSALRQSTFVADMETVAKAFPNQLEMAPQAIANRKEDQKHSFRSYIRNTVKRLLVRVINKNIRIVTRLIKFSMTHTVISSHYKIVGIKPAQRRNQPYDQKTRWQISNRRDPASISLISYTLTVSSQPAHWLNLALKTSTFNEGEIILAIDNLFRTRSSALNILLEQAETLPAESAIRLWLIIRRAVWKLSPSTLNELRANANKVYNYTADSYVRKQLESVLLSQIIQIGTDKEVREFIAKAGLLTLEKMGINQKMGILKKLSQYPETREYATSLRQQFEQSMSGLEQLKLKNMDVLEGNAPIEWNHQYLENEFERHAPKPVAQQFHDEIYPVYKQLRHRFTYMDVRINTRQSDALKERIRTAIVERIPFSLIRLGDGEGYLFSDNAHHFQQDDIANRERHWWGEELPSDLRREIIRQGRAALQTADVIGIPSIHRFIRDISYKSTSITASLQGRGLIEVVQNVTAAASTTAKFTEDRVNVSLFQTEDYLHSIMKLASKVILVSSISTDKLPSNLKTQNKITTIAVPTHYRTAGNNNYHTITNSFPYVYKDLIDELISRIEPGTLVLVAAGVIGKIFIGVAREKNAVTLDIGGVVDDWISPAMPTIR